MRISKKVLDELCESLNSCYNSDMQVVSTCGYYNLELDKRSRTIVAGKTANELYNYLCGMKAVKWYLIKI